MHDIRIVTSAYYDGWAARLEDDKPVANLFENNCIITGKSRPLKCSLISFIRRDEAASKQIDALETRLSSYRGKKLFQCATRISGDHIAAMEKSDAEAGRPPLNTNLVRRYLDRAAGTLCVPEKHDFEIYQQPPYLDLQLEPEAFAAIWRQLCDTTTERVELIVLAELFKPESEAYRETDMTYLAEVGRDHLAIACQIVVVSEPIRSEHSKASGSEDSSNIIRKHEKMSFKVDTLINLLENISKIYSKSNIMIYIIFISLLAILFRI